eukprot:COSAG02_NODE_61249_length_269_cov_0.611765_1_plen_66_part_01
MTVRFCGRLYRKKAVRRCSRVQLLLYGWFPVRTYMYSRTSIRANTAVAQPSAKADSHGSALQVSPQ